MLKNKKVSKKNIRQIVLKIPRAFWRSLPFQNSQKIFLKNLIFQSFPFLFFWTGIYKDWEKSNHKLYKICIDGMVQIISRINNKISRFFLKRRIILVAHDAQPYGAEYLILHMAKYLNQVLEFRIDMFILGRGQLLSEYAKYAELHIITNNQHLKKAIKKTLPNLYNSGVQSVIANTTVTGKFTEFIKAQGFNIVSLVHELEWIIKKLGLQEHAKALAEYSDFVVFPATLVAESFRTFAQIPIHKQIIAPQGLFRKNLYQTVEQKTQACQNLKVKLKLPTHAQIVLSIGYADQRKGIDLFVDIGMEVLKKNNKIYFIWIGNFDLILKEKIFEKIKNSNLADHFIFPGQTFETDIYYASANVYALTSREDPFPSVVLEALDAGLPIVAYEGAGGFCELLKRDAGYLIPKFDIEAFAIALNDLLQDKTKGKELGLIGKKIVETEHSFRRYIFDLLALAKTPIKRVSVIVPNYNYAHYLVERIESILRQETPLYELILLDDCSSDNSIEVLQKITSNLNIDFQIVTNEKNSGNPFAQWFKGVELAKGDYIWIAEADDKSYPNFLSSVLPAFDDDSSVVLSYCQSKQMDSNGNIINNNYLDYIADISEDKWTKSYIEEGIKEICTGLAIKNTIPNVSAVVFKREILYEVLKTHIKEIRNYRFAGDWLTYIYVASKGKIAFCKNSLNMHRRHNQSVINSSLNMDQLEEVLLVQKKVRENFKLDNEVIEAAKKYSNLIYRNFNLQTCSMPCIEKHPHLVNYLEISQ